MTFYQFFRDENDSARQDPAVGLSQPRVHVMRGSDELTTHLCESLGVKPGGTTADKKITLETAECIGACEGRAGRAGGRRRGVRRDAPEGGRVAGAVEEVIESPPMAIGGYEKPHRLPSAGFGGQ
ncbi:MAG: NAD(P)H-dependent oxidoreductase subunit E [Gemmataceae bacterium]